MSEIIGHKKGGGDQHTHYEETDSLHSISYARVLDLVSEGEILGLAHGLKSVYLNQTPIENADGTTNFNGITVDFRTGTQIQDYIPGFPDVENEIAVGTELRSGAPWTHAVNNLSLSAIRITLSVPALSKGDTTNGDILGYKVDYKIELSTDNGAYAVVLTNSFNGKTTTPYQRSARIDLPTATIGWSVRVTRLTANANTASTADTTTVVSYTEVIDAKLRYPMSAIVGVQVDAKQFQSVPTRSYDLYGRIIQVPSNYDPVTRIYTSVWDGTFKPAWTSNPAWIFRDLVLNDRYGLGQRITAAQIDKWALYAIAQYCDQMVPNGKGSTEPRFTCNLYLQSQKQAYAVLQDLASVFRGISYWGGGSIIASSDRPMDPVYVYTAANVIGGKFSRVGSSKKTRATVALVSWNDPADFYRAKVEYVEDQEGISRYGIQQINLTSFGCTSQGQAQRAGRWALATSRLETEMISFDVGMDGAIAIPGQIVRVADPARMGKRNGGRVRSASGRVVTLDKAPVISAGDSLTVILPTGVSETRTVASVASDSVTVSADWSTIPLAQSVWSVDSSTLMAPTYKILSVKEKGDGLTYTITATQHEPGKFDYIENGTAIAPRPQTSLDVTKQTPPTSVSIAAYTVSLQDVQKLAMSIACDAVPGAVAYEGAYKFGSGNWVSIPRQPSPVMDVLDVLPGTYIAKIAAVNSIGITSIETLSVATAIAKDGNSKNADVLLSSSVPAFHINTAGANDPASIAFKATLIALDGPVTFTIVGGTLTSITDTGAVLTFANMSAASASVTASVTVFGRTYSDTCGITKMQDGAPGTAGQKTAVIRLYQWSATAPSAPTGTSTYTWATAANSTYSVSDGWIAVAPSNPGTPLIRLYIAEVSITAAGGAVTSTVSYSGAAVAAWSQNGATGPSGVQSTSPTVYQWAATIPAGPSGTPTYTWASSSFGSAPSGWTLTPGASPSAGMTLWAARVQVTDSAANTTTAFNWSTAAVMAIGYAGSNGASYVTAYCASATGSATSAPAQTTGKTSLPAANSGGITGTYTATVPTLTAGQYQYQTDGIYDPGTDKITWSIPYWSSLKVATLSAISANLGAVTAGSIDLGTGTTSWHVDAAGNEWSGASTYAAAPYRRSNTGDVVMKSVSIQDSSGNVVLASGTPLAAGYEAPGTKNSDLTPAISSVAGVSLLVRGSVSVFGNTVIKTIGTANTWDSDCYSKDGYVGGAVAEAVIVANGYGIMFGLNSDPLTDGSYTSLDYAIYLRGDGTLGCLESNVDRGSIGTYVAGDTFAVAFNGSNVYYLKNGSVLRTVASTITTALFFDSSFATPGGSLSNIRFSPLSSNAWSAIGGTGKPADNATVGAPLGTYVAGTLAGIIEANSANGASAYTAVNDATTGLSARLSRTSASSLAATVTVTTGGSILSGTTTNGTYQNPAGFFGVQGGVVKFSVPISGDPTFAGALAAAYGTFGAVTIAAGGSVSSGQTAYGTGSGFWMENVGGVVKFSLGSSTEYLRWSPSGGLEQKLATFTVTGLAGITSNGANGLRSYGSMTATPVGGVAPYQYKWSVDPFDSLSTSITASSVSTATASFSGSATNYEMSAGVTCTITDANGRVASQFATIYAGHGTF